MDKNKSNKNKLMVLYGFWSMMILFVLMIVLSFFRLQIPSLIAGILFILSIFFVFVTSIQAIVPENSMAYIALGIAILFILYLIFSATISATPSVLG